MATIILVHGAWHGGWCWAKLKAALEARGHKVLTPDLPGHDRKEGPAATTSLADYAHAIADLADAQDEPPLLVGHSMGGGVVSQAAAYTQRLKGILILAGFALRDGQSIIGLAEEGPDQDLGDNLVYSEDGGHATIVPEAIAGVLYGDCCAEEQVASAACLVPQAAKPFMDPVEDPEHKADKVAKFAIVCSQDRAVDPALQRRMFEAVGAKTWELQASHSPFLSQPEAVADIIEQAAA